jgi:CheY-like chemotaxis protein
MQSKTIIVVEDDPLTAQLVAGVLRGLGHRVETCDDSERAVALAVRLVPAAMLVDLRLGAESGEALIARLADDRRTAGIPVIAMTAANEPEVLATLDRAGVVALLEKPFSATDVAALVEAVLMAGPK